MRSGELKLPSASVKKQIASKELWNLKRDRESADFFTLGYSGRSFSEIRDSLLANHVRTLLDVRTNAVSMYRPEFSKSNLKQSLEALGLIYVHQPELGVPRDIRAQAIKAGSRDVIWHWYDEFVARVYFSNLNRFMNGFEHPVAMMCSELDPKECHRHRLGLVLERAGLSSFDL